MVQNVTTSAPKLDLPLSQLTMGCWDAITIKATPLYYRHLSTYTTPILHLPLQKILTIFLFYHFPQIVPLCPALSKLRGEWWSLNLNILDETECECVRVHWSVCVCYVFGAACVPLQPVEARVRHGWCQPSPFKSKSCWAETSLI